MIAASLQYRDNINSFIEDIIMPKLIDHTGKKFGKLTVLGLTGKSGNDRKCLVKCDCGTEKEVVQSRLTANDRPTKSCGCLSRENHFKTHGLTRHKWYPIWRAMIARCENPSNKSYKDYGGRGVSVCEEWKIDLQGYFDWLELNGYGPDLQIDRKDNDGNYCPENCRVVTQKQNCNNRRDTKKYYLDGAEMTMAQMSEKSGVKYGTLRKRIKTMGLSPEESTNMKLWQRVVPVGG